MTNYPCIVTHILEKSQEIRYIADRLRQERARLRLTQTAMAALGGVSKTTQVGYEAGLHPPDAVYLSRLAQNLVDTTFVLTGDRDDVKAGISLNWDLIEDLLDVLKAFEEAQSTRLTSATKAQLLRVLYSASIATGRVDPGVAAAAMARAA